MKRWPGGSLLMASAQFAPASAITLEELQDATLQTRVNYDMRIRRAECTFDTKMTMVWAIQD